MGGKKPPKAKSAKASSPYSGVNEYNVNLDGFGSANALKKDGKLNVTSSLAPALKPSYDAATSGLSSNLNYLNATPEQHLADLSAGKNSFYNLQNSINQRALDNQIGQAQSRFSANGLENSTVRGGFEGALASDSIFRDMATRQSSLDYLHGQAVSDAAVQNTVLQGLANNQQVPLQLANQNIFHGLDNVSQTSQFNAQQQQQANMLNAQMQAQAQQAQQAMWGNIIGQGIGAVGSFATGGLSGLLGAGLGAAGKAASSGVSSGLTNSFNNSLMNRGSSFLGTTY